MANVPVVCPVVFPVVFPIVPTMSLPIVLSMPVTPAVPLCSGVCGVRRAMGGGVVHGAGRRHAVFTTVVLLVVGPGVVSIAVMRVRHRMVRCGTRLTRRRLRLRLRM